MRYPDEDALVQQVADGDNDAFQTLHARYHRNILRICWRIAKNDADAQELVQETFFKAWRRIGSFNRRSSFSTWLSRIAINECLSRLRKVGGHEDLFDTVPDEGKRDPRLESCMEIDELKKAIMKLPFRDRRVIELQLMGHGHEAIAGAIGETKERSKNIRFRAIKKLRVEIARPPRVALVRPS
jgi:RNA polymerase sigma-70 factor (ECF subfamily)